jgi:uncharacterized protein
MEMHCQFESVKRLWEEDTRSGIELHIVLLGPAPLLVQQGLTESLAGRFEKIHLPHWSYTEMRQAFGFTVEDYLIYGSYPGAASLIEDPDRWREYILEGLVETTIARDVLLMSRVDKPALLRRLFELGCRYSGQILSLTKLMGQLQDAGNTTTLSHYLELLTGAGILTGLQKHAGQIVRQRASSPKFQVLNTALLTALSSQPSEPTFSTTRSSLVTRWATGAKEIAKWTLSCASMTKSWRSRSRAAGHVRASPA